MTAQQNIDIKGRIVDQNGQPVIGASLFQQGTNNGTVADVDGRFSINVPNGASLKVSCLGYQDVIVTARNGMTIMMKEDNEVLSEVVVVGYGAQKRADITGAVASVDVGKTLESRPIADVGRGLQGAVPGMNIVVPTGEVGSDPLIKIRGQIGSINGGSSPLILLDNVEIPSIQLVNPNDIQSITVLEGCRVSLHLWLESRVRRCAHHNQERHPRPEASGVIFKQLLMAEPCQGNQHRRDRGS